MWIQSQNEEMLMDFSGFIMFEGIEQVKLQCRRIVKDNKNTVIMGKSEGTLHYIGVYETKERALEVLKYIRENIGNSQPANKFQYNVVLNMPKE
jgi:hypothetical protein